MRDGTRDALVLFGLKKLALHPAAWGAMIGTPLGAGAGYFLAPEDHEKLPYVGMGALGGGLLGTSVGGIAGLFSGGAPSSAGPSVGPSSGPSPSSSSDVLRALIAPIARNVREGNLTSEQGAAAIHEIISSTGRSVTQ